MRLLDLILETADSGVMAYEKEQFKSIDKDRNGFIDFDELKNHIKEGNLVNIFKLTVLAKICESIR